MYIIRAKDKRGSYKFKTYDGWATLDKNTGSYSLEQAIRFTEGEAKANPSVEFVWFGCYKELK